MVRQQTDRIDREGKPMFHVNPWLAEQLPGKVTGKNGRAMVGDNREEMGSPGNPSATIIRHGLDYIEANVEMVRFQLPAACYPNPYP
jgi:hypothetical protein